MQTRSIFWFALSALFGGLLIVSGCDSTIDPFSEQATYSIHGFLSLNRTQQFIRVKSLQSPLDADTSRLDATVTLKNLNSGSSHRLKDSVVVFRDANSRVVTHNFWTDLSIQPNTQYKLTVQDTSGTTTATTTTPPRVTAFASPEEGNCLTNFTIEFPQVNDGRRISNVRVRFTGKDQSLLYRIDESIHGGEEDGESNAFLTFTPGGLLGQEFGFNADDPETPCQRETHCSKLASKEIQVRYTYLGEDWYGDIPDDSLLTDPLNSPHVQNGSGFFGSLGRGRITVETDTTAISFDREECL